MDLALTFEDDGTGHDDLVLRLGDFSRRCDSYYLALDQRILAGREDGSKVRVVLRALLEQWRAAIALLADGSTTYLPYDFSDQYTAWLACERRDDTLYVSHGWAEVEGWSFSPSDFSAYAMSVPGFRRDAGPWEVPTEAFVASILRSIDAAA